MWDYVLENARQRKLAKTKQEKQYRKNLSNVVYGRCLLNKRKHVDAVFVMDSRNFKREVSKSKFKRYVAFGEESGLVFHNRAHFDADQFVFIGAAILSISKLIMMRFYYDVIMPFCERKSIRPQLTYQDTDSFVLEFVYPEQPRAGPPSNFYHDIFDILPHLDLHEYPLTHAFYASLTPEELKIALEYRESNKRKMGAFSDEISEGFLAEFAGLRAKAYSLRTTTGEVMKCGGTSVFKSMTDFNFNLYKAVALREKLVHFAKQRRFFSDRHNMIYKSIQKQSFTSFDDKRFLCKDGINTLALGHYSIPYLQKNWAHIQPSD